MPGPLPDPALTAVLERLDGVVSELQELRAQVAAMTPAKAAHVPDLEDTESDDFAPIDQMLDVGQAAQLAEMPKDTIRKWCRDTKGTPQAIGRYYGSRWRVDARRLRRLIKGG